MWRIYATRAIDLSAYTVHLLGHLTELTNIPSNLCKAVFTCVRHPSSNVLATVWHRTISYRHVTLSIRIRTYIFECFALECRNATSINGIEDGSCTLGSQFGAIIERSKI